MRRFLCSRIRVALLFSPGTQLFARTTKNSFASLPSRTPEETAATTLSGGQLEEGSGDEGHGEEALRFPVEEDTAVQIATFADVAPLKRETTRSLARRKAQFSFFSSHVERSHLDFPTVYEVPNNAPKQLLPVWASSLTSPALSKQRLAVENWISMDCMEKLPKSKVDVFLRWLHDHFMRNGSSELWHHLEQGIEFHLRPQYSRGVIARKTYLPGDVIFAIPIQRTSSAHSNTNMSVAVSASSPHPLVSSGLVPEWGPVLNSEILQQYSLAARRRHVPSYERVRAIVGRQKSSFDPVPHPLFVDQLHFALLLACERAEGVKSLLHPYLTLLAPFDDDRIRELHRDVLDPATYLEYSDHCGRFTHYMRQIHSEWVRDYEAFRSVGESGEVPAAEGCVAGGANRGEVNTRAVSSECEASCGPSSRLPPPLMDDLVWALRVVLSRQRLLPLRQNISFLESTCNGKFRPQERESLWSRLYLKIQNGASYKPSSVDDHARQSGDDHDPRAIASLVPVLDMLQHPPGGVANTCCGLEVLPSTESGVGLGDCSANGDSEGKLCAVIRAAREIEENDELTTLFSRCYSLSYTLYRFGFLPLRRRTDDLAALTDDLVKRERSAVFD
ncbi:hypothetical protein ERJ75_000358300 [Trypanosoma vivax]|uniref:SET domain-containing protein n=1 Tax=Trypanosoma vivax (strain Y486) TaxID=1055687 RepID=G0TZU8_TRYVY|nr:hypothetical protein TRVL_01476 [Trypanosoma vivax]KAH8617600.1 hypothetical protein ERJ75_000358300 [Trypanosoma vivax]CCC50126.1 conserved hypothetical protein [Trypanosoma vivax Y486]